MTRTGEQWQPEFSIIEEGVLRASRQPDCTIRWCYGAAPVGAAKAALVRCLVCPGAVVARGSTLMDRLVDGGNSVRKGSSRS